MRKRSPARWLAPVALAAAVIAVFTIVGGGRGGDEEPADGGGTPAAAETTPTTTTRTQRERGKGGGERTTTTPTRTTRADTRTYTVQPGDTFSSIASANGTTIEELQELNPDVDSSALSVGDELRLPAAEGE